MYDPSTGQTADVFDQFEIEATDPDSPSISADGQTLLNGGPFAQIIGQQYFSAVTLTSLSTFPNGPFGRSIYEPQYSFPEDGKVYDPVESGSLVAFDMATCCHPVTEGIMLGQLGGPAAPLLTSATTGCFKAAIRSPGGSPTVVFEEHPPGGASYIASLPAWPLASFLGAPTLLPETVNAPNSYEFAPAFTTDGRYIGFLRVITSITTTCGCSCGTPRPRR